MDDEATEAPGVWDKASADASSSGYSITVESGCVTGELQPREVGESISKLIARVGSEQNIYLGTLRLVVVSPQLGHVVSRWERDLGLPSAGLSNQPEGVAVAKTMFWGTDETSARSVVMLADHIAAAAAIKLPFAVATVAHELGHVHDDILRGMVLGFPQSQSPPGLGDWPRLCASLAEIAWSEFWAESIATPYMAREALSDWTKNDLALLEGVHTRIQQSIKAHRSSRQTNIVALWSPAVTSVSNALANLGRAIARLAAYELDADAAEVLIADDGQALAWKPVVRQLAHELRSLGSKSYDNWGADPFYGLRDVVAAAFRACGFLPIYDGRLRIELR